MQSASSFPSRMDRGLWLGSLSGSLYDRETRQIQRPQLASLYSHRHWVRDLDIVNELSGHTGCVNALSWSASGRLLASGSDDTFLNIHKYQPDDDTSQFSLATAIATGHTANIFSVKFMPHSNDRTLISAAGDGEIRVFDLEHSSTTAPPSNAASIAAAKRLRARGLRFNVANQLSDGDTNCRVYRSHRDRVKRLVTESSPHLFLSCSEDGEVRQWDLRQPSSAYPRPASPNEPDSGDVPPALISYREYALDLNTISCSASQPYYIALGGAHLHCLLHDRRMLGRNRLREQGDPGTSRLDTEMLDKATRCVRRFAPDGQRTVKAGEDGHITACKISDAHPNELIVSWSGEHVYSFDMHRSPHADELHKYRRHSSISNGLSNRVRESADKKRKRSIGSVQSLSQQGSDRAQARSRAEETSSPQSSEGQIALRVQYGNGQSEDIPIGTARTSLPAAAPSQAQTELEELARRLRWLHTTLLSPHLRLSGDAASDRVEAYTTMLEHCASALPQLKAMHHSWSYPAGNEAEIFRHRRLRAERESHIRFVQAAGVFARASGGKLESSLNLALLDQFEQIVVSTTEGPDLSVQDQFAYDFLKAIFLWLNSGIGALLEGFSSRSSRHVKRFPVPIDSGMDAIDEYFIPYLLELSSDSSIINLDTSRFETDERRLLFTSERDAVHAFARALNTPFSDLSSDTPPESIESGTQDRQQAMHLWGYQVARGLLKGTSTFNSSAFCRAFGGTAPREPEPTSEERTLQQNLEEIDTTLEERAADEMAILAEEMIYLAESGHDDGAHNSAWQDDVSEETGSANGNVDSAGTSGDLHEDEDEDEDAEEEDDASDDGETDVDDEAEFESDLDNEDEDDDDLEDLGLPRRVFRSTYERPRKLDKVEEHVPCMPHTKVYRGHCNSKTVKDVNFWGLSDEYVCSGSDDGNFFIWDRNAKIVNILEGDGEVVNVIQGHPYEPMLAVSGIDNTVKIFSSDAKARNAARLGHGVEAADSSTFTSISWPRRRGSRPPRAAGLTGPPERPENEPGNLPNDEDEDDNVATENGLRSRRRLHLEYQITSDNDSRRQNGNQDAFITVEDLIMQMLMHRSG